MKRWMTTMCCACLLGAAAAAQTGSTDKMPKDHMTMSDMHGALNVKSVKMISATCP